MSRQQQLLSQFKEPAFPKQTVEQFVRNQLALTDDVNVGDHLFTALQPAHQTAASRECIDKALKNDINAGAVVIALFDTQSGPKLFAARSLRRNWVFGAGGTCLAADTKAERSALQTAMDEFKEEAGNPDDESVMSRCVDEKHMVSVAVINKIGDDAKSIADRIVSKKGKKASLYVSLSMIVRSPKITDEKQLTQEIEALNEKIMIAAHFYKTTCAYLFSQSPDQLLSDQNKNLAVALIEQFRTKCQASITPNFTTLLESITVNSTLPEIKNALLAIVDLTENCEVRLWAVDEEIYGLMACDEKTQQKAGFFSGTLESLASHMLKNETPEFFFKRLMTLQPIAVQAVSLANLSVVLMPRRSSSQRDDSSTVLAAASVSAFSS